MLFRSFINLRKRYRRNPKHHAFNRDATEGTDFHAIQHRQVSITPLQLDLSHVVTRQHMLASNWNKN